MIRNRIRHICCLLIAGISLNVATAFAAQDRGSLLELVGSDAGVVIEVDNLRNELKNIKNCEVLRRLRQTNLFQKWKASDDFRNLVLSRSVIEQLVGKPLPEFVNDLFGQSVVVAVYPTAEEQGDVVLMTRAKASADLDSAIAGWNRAERSKLTPLEFDGHPYTLREKVNPKQKSQPPQYTTRFGPVLVLSNSEPAIRRVISLKQAATTANSTTGDSAIPRTRSFGSSPAYTLATEVLPRSRFVTLHINPRVWDDRLNLDPQKSKAAKDLLRIWQRCDSLALALSVDQNGLFLDGVAHVSRSDEGRISAVAQTDEVPAFLSHVPRRAVAVFAGRHNLARLAKVLLGWIPDNERQEFSRARILARGMLSGFDLVDDILPALGKQWGVYLVEATGDTAERAPLDAVLGVELPPPGQIARGNFTLRDSLDNALQTSLRLVASFAGGKQSTGEPEVVSEQDANGAMIRAIDAGPAMRPAFALTQEHLAVGTSQRAVGEFAGLKQSESLAADSALLKFAKRRFPESTQLIYINADSLREIIAANESSLAERLAGTDKMDRAAALERIRGLNNLLQAFDTLFVAGRSDGEKLHLRAGIAAEVSDAGTDR